MYSECHQLLSLLVATDWLNGHWPISLHCCTNDRTWTCNSARIVYIGMASICEFSLYKLSYCITVQRC